MLSGNKGEWSEVYALFKLLTDKVLDFAGSTTHTKRTYPVLQVKRTESDKKFTYDCVRHSPKIMVDVSDGVGTRTFEIDETEFQKYADILLQRLKSPVKGNFESEVVEQFMQSMESTKIKAASSVKSDISIVIHDQGLGISPELGFSIKSQLGGSSTLLNASGATNFIFKISEVPNRVCDYKKYSETDGIKSRVNNLYLDGHSLKYVGTGSSVFFNNMVLVDSAMPEIMAQVLIIYYRGLATDIKGICRILNDENPLGYDMQSGHSFYEYKIKRFLTDVALGLMPSKVWLGQLEATGGYLIVKNSGDLVCYHIYNRNDFEDYLFNNVKLETASSSRHNFGTIYSESGNLMINLNLQIRFI